MFAFDPVEYLAESSAASIVIPNAFLTQSNPARCRIFRLVLNQGECGACIAFAHATAASMRLCLNRDIDFIPSPYRLFDCAQGDCGRGLSFPEIMPWLSAGVDDLNMSLHSFGQGCSVNHDHGVFISKMTTNARKIQLDIMQNGPVMGEFVIENDFASWHDNGIFHVNRSNSESVHKHAMVILGWGAYPEPHWIIKNSWGVKWGNKGFARMELGALNYAISHNDTWNMKTKLLGWIYTHTRVAVFFSLLRWFMLFVSLSVIWAAFEVGYDLVEDCCKHVDLDGESMV